MRRGFTRNSELGTPNWALGRRPCRLAQMFDAAVRRGSSPSRDRLRAALSQKGRAGPVVRDTNVTTRVDLSVLGGHWFETPLGPGYVIESLYEAGHAHGEVPLHRALTADATLLAGQVRDPRLGSIQAERFLYVDTETTGPGGAGSMVFLAGTARFDGGLLRLRQYLLPSPDYEGGLLGGLGEDLAAAEALVSYNGKSFDLPMLETRYILSRQRPEFRSLPHLDLLHPNRRLFRGSLDSHKLPIVERELLGFEREDDCPSAEVPVRYFQFQRSGDPTHILPVLRHNAWDILSLVALAAHIAGVCESAEYPLQSARAAEYAGEYALAAGRYEAALERGLPRALRLEAMEKAARAHHRAGAYEAAAAHWQALIDEPRSRRITPYVELAKLAEHRLRDLPRAYMLADEAAALMRRGLLMPGTGELSLDALERRRERLAGRLRRAKVG